MNPRPYTIRDLFFKHIALTSSSPLALEIERAEGVFLFERGGRRVLDLVSGVSVSNIGHSNREVIDATKRQLESHMHLMVYGEIIQTPQIEHAALLTSLLDPSLQSVYYLNSGSEAVEVALKLAKRATGRGEIISCYNGYHGSTHGALSVMGSERYKEGYRPLLPGVSHINFNSFEELSQIDERVAAVIVEPIMAEAGVISPVRGWLAALRERCNQSGTLLIFDEVQSGFGRTGALFAHQKEGVVPDILVLAKALGGGMPLGATVASKELMSHFQFNPPLGHITTFGGHPVCCAAALASLKVLLKEGWIEEVEQKSAIFVERLQGHPLVKKIRAEGLLIAVDLVKEEYADQIIELLLDEGVLCDWFLFYRGAFRIAPPLSINREEIELALEAIERALERLSVKENGKER